MNLSTPKPKISQEKPVEAIWANGRLFCGAMGCTAPIRLPLIKIEQIRAEHRCGVCHVLNVIIRDLEHP